MKHKTVKPDGTFDIESLSAAEKERLYEQCEQIDAKTSGEPLSPVQRRLHAKILRRGRPRVGLGAARAQVMFERGLLKEIDRAARSRGLTRSRLLTQAVRAYLGRAA